MILASSTGGVIVNLSILSSIFSTSSSARMDVSLVFGGTFSCVFGTGLFCGVGFGDDGLQPISKNERMNKCTNFNMWKVFLYRGYVLFLFGPEAGST